LTTNKQKIIDALIDFVIRASSKAASPKELEVLPEIAKILLDCAANSPTG